jgi:very-short-patch-repair endonuclease
MGEAEKRLWTRLRRNQIGFHFRRQAPVGPYFLDFYCAKARLCIEVDGDLHAQRSAEDRQRDLYLQQLGILTLRVPSGELYAHLDAVVEYIAKLPLDAEANASALHRVGALRGRGAWGEGKTARALPHAGEGDMECGSEAFARR